MPQLLIVVARDRRSRTPRRSGDVRRTVAAARALLDRVGDERPCQLGRAEVKVGRAERGRRYHDRMAALLSADRASPRRLTQCCHVCRGRWERRHPLPPELTGCLWPSSPESLTE